MIEFKESKFYKLLQDFSLNNDKETFLQMLAEFYNRTEGILEKDDIQDDLIKELRELYLEFNEKGIDKNIVREKVNYFLENSLKIKNILAKLAINTNKIEDVNTKLNVNTNNIEYISSQLDNKASKDDVAKISSGTPLFASSTAEMTDTTKNYVNTTDGYLYIYSGGSWVKTTVQYQSTGIEDKTITTKKLTDDVRLSPKSLINLEKNLIDIDYLNNPLSFISWYNTGNTTIIEDKINKINGFNSINIQSNSTDTNWNMLKEIPYTKQGTLTFSYLRKASILNGQNVNAVDNNNKWYGGNFEVLENYYKGWDLVKYTINIITDITSIQFYIGNFNGINNYNVGLYSILEGDYEEILPKWSIDDLSEEVQTLIRKQVNEYKIKNLGGLLDDSYSLNPKSFISWNNTSTSTIKNNETILMDYLSLNTITTLSSGVHYLNSIAITNLSKTSYTFSCLLKINNGSNNIFIDAIDNNGKYYRSSDSITSVTENYFNGYNLITFTFNISTDITSLNLLIGYDNSSNFDIGLFSLWEGTTKLEIISNIVTYERLDDELKLKISEIGTNTLDLMKYDMLLPSKLFMINEEPLRLYKKNIIASADSIRDLELSVTSYTDDEFWNTSNQPYVDYINDKLELNSNNIMGNKIKFNLVGNDLKTRLFKEIEVVKRSKSEVNNKSVIVNMFGDSTTHNGLNYGIKKLLESYFKTVKCIGTKSVNGVAAEARGGWLYQQYIGYRTTYSNNDLPINEVDFPNFLKVATDEDKQNKGDWCFTRTGSDREKTYNEIVASGGDTSQNFYIFDYAHYLQTNRFEPPTFVTLGMGINDYWKYPNDATELCEKALNIIIRQIHEASPTTKFILQPFPTKGSNDIKSEWFKKCLELENYFRDTLGVDIEIVAEHLSQNKDLFFPTTITELEGKVTNKEVISDDIHTTYAGYSEGARPIVYCMINKID